MTNSYIGINEDDTTEANKDKIKYYKKPTFGGVELTQYTAPKIRNPYNGTLEIYGDSILIETFARGEKKQITILDQRCITFKIKSEDPAIRNEEDTKPTRVNKIPEINIVKIVNFKKEVLFREIQDSACIRVEIIDDYPDNLDITFEGPFSVKQIDKNLFDLKLQLFDSEDDLKKWINDKSSPNTINLIVRVQDRIAPHKVEKTIPIYLDESVKDNNQNYPQEKNEIKKPPDPPESNLLGYELIQYSEITLNNPYKENLEVIAKEKTLAVIPPKQKVKFVLGSDSSVIFKVGDKIDTKMVKPNKKPEVKLNRIGISGPDASLMYIQDSVYYKLEINDDRPDNLDINIQGPVTFEQVSPLGYHIKLNYLHSQAEFDNFIIGKKVPYKVTFTVNVKDKYCSDHLIEENREFIFSKW